MTLPLHPSLSDILRATSETLDMPVEVLLGPKRTDASARARQLCAYCASKFGYRNGDIAKTIDRDQSTVHQSVEAIARHLDDESAESGAFTRAVRTISRRAVYLARMTGLPADELVPAEIVAFPKPSKAASCQNWSPERMYTPEWWKRNDDLFCGAMRGEIDPTRKWWRLP